MVDIRPKDLPAVTSVTAGDKVTLDGATTRSITVENLAGSGALKSNAQAIGYQTGAGGAVTQLTSRTTAVTLNKPSGAVTLFTAAGSTSVTSFTVNNTAVAVTDTIVVSVRSAVNFYVAFVSLISANSFQISFYTTGGTTSDTPIFNFNVIKGVNA